MPVYNSLYFASEGDHTFILGLLVKDSLHNFMQCADTVFPHLHVWTESSFISGLDFLTSKDCCSSWKLPTLMTSMIAPLADFNCSTAIGLIFFPPKVGERPPCYCLATAFGCHSWILTSTHKSFKFVLVGEWFKCQLKWYCSSMNQANKRSSV